MDVSESKKALDTTRHPLVLSENKNGTTRRSQTREVSSRHRSPSPSHVSKRCPSPNISTRTSTSTTVPVPKRAISAERKRPSTPPSTPVRDTSASRKTVTDNLPESSLWPSKMRSLNVSFQSDTSVSHNRPSSNVARKSDTPERKRSPLKGKNSTDLSENSRVVDSLHRWPSRTGGKVSTNKSDITDKITKTPSLFPSRIDAPSNTRRLSLDGTSSKPLQKSANDLLKLISHDESRKEKIHGNSVDDDDDDDSLFDRTSLVNITDKITKTPSLFPSRIVAPSNTRRLSLDGTSSKPLQKSANDLLKLISLDKSRKEILHVSSVDDDDDALFDRTSSVNITDKITNTPSVLPSRIIAPSSGTRRLSLDGTRSKPLRKTSSDLLKLISGDKSKKEMLQGSSVVDDDDALFDRTSLVNISDKITKNPSLFPSRTVALSPCTRRLSLDGTSSKPLQKTSNDLLKLISRDESRKETLHGSSIVDDDELFDKTSLVNISDKINQTSSLFPSRTVAPSSCTRKLSLDGTSSKPLQKTSSDLLKLRSREESRKEMLHGNSIVDDALFDKTSLVNISDKITITPSLFPSRTAPPSSCTRRLSLDGKSSKPLQKTTSEFLKLIPREQSTKEILQGSSVFDDDDALFDRTSLVNIADKITKAPSLFPSRTVAPSSCTRRLSLDGTSSRPLQKSTNDLLKLISRDESRKEISHGSSVVVDDDDDYDDDDDALLDRTSLVNATTLRRQSLPNTGTGIPSPLVSKRVSPSRARSVNPCSRGTSPARLRPSSPLRQPQNPVLSFVADIKKVKKVDKNFEDVHRLRLLYSRHLQWRYANARTIAALNSQKAKAEKIFYSVWKVILDLWDVVREKRSDLQQLRFTLKLCSLLDNQMTCLKEWASIERDHTSSLTCTIRDLQATTIGIPVTAGATVDIKIVKAAMCSAVDVMMEMGSSLCSILPQVEGMNCLVSKLSDVAAHERAMLDECESLLRSTAAYQIEENSLMTQLLQMNQALDKW